MSRLQPSALSLRTMRNSYLSLATKRVSSHVARHVAPRRDFQALSRLNMEKRTYPGHGMAIDWSPPSHYKSYASTPGLGSFSHGVSFNDDWRPEDLNNVRPLRMTRREIAMLQLMDTLTDKPEWEKKVFNETIVAKWRKEAANVEDILISDKTFSWCIEELRDRAGELDDTGLVKTLEGGFRVVKSDTLINDALRGALLEAMAPLLQVSESNKDWHPGSEQRVLNHVHPSLYPLVYGRSMLSEENQNGLLGSVERSQEVVLSERGQGMHTKKDRWTGKEHLSYWSNKYQWLPANVCFDGPKGTAVKFNSYINNLDPRSHQKLYNVIEKLVELSIPAWNESLIRGGRRNDVRIRTFGVDTIPSDRPEWGYSWNWEHEDCKENEALMEKLYEYLKLPENPNRIPDEYEVDLPSNFDTAPIWEWDTDNDGYEWEFGRAVDWKFARIRKVQHPEPGEAYTYEQWTKGDTKDAVGGTRASGRYAHVFPVKRDGYKIELEKEFRKEGLQVIVKMASVELTPERPDYPGGSWHLEGMLNEHIVGTAIYYYDVENCSTSRLSFRQEAELDNMGFTYEQGDFGPIHELFGTETLWDEPAVQYVGSVETKQGRLIAFPNTMQHKVEPFELVDKTKPGHRRYLVLWLVDPTYRIISTANVAPQQRDWYKGGRVEGTMTLEEAKEYRLDLMSERTIFTKNVESNFMEYNFCEH